MCNALKNPLEFCSNLQKLILKGKIFQKVACFYATYGCFGTIYGTENNHKGLIIITTLYTHKKDIITSPIRSLVRNGEKNADVITIVTDRYYNGFDLSTFGFVMEGRTASDSLSVQNLSFETADETLSIFFKVTDDFTAIPGPLKLTMKAVSTTDDVCLIFSGGEIEVVGNSNEDCLPTEIGEQLLLQIEETIAAFEGQIESVADQKVSNALAAYDIPAIVAAEIPDNIVTSDSVRTLITLTQEEYDALEIPDSTVMYIITDQT